MTVSTERDASLTARPPYLLLIAMSAVGPLALNIFVPSIPGLQSTFGASAGTVQLTLTLYLVGIAVCQLFYGPLSDRYGRRPMLLAGLAVFVAASVMAALATSIEMLIAARLLQALGGASGMVLARAIVRDLFSRERSASVLGYITMIWVVAPMVAPSLGGLLEHYADFRASFWLLAGLGALVLAGIWSALPETNGNRNPTAPLVQTAVFARLARSRRFAGYTTSIACSSSVFFVFLAVAPFLVVTVHGGTPLDYGLWFIVVSCGYMTGNFASGRYSERLGNDRMIRIGNAVTLTGALAALILVVGLPFHPMLLFAPMTLCAFGNGITLPNGIVSAISVDPANIGTGAGLSGFLQMGFAALMSQTAGMIQGAHPYAGLWIMAVCATAAMAAHRVAVRYQGRN